MATHLSPLAIPDGTSVKIKYTTRTRQKRGLMPIELAVGGIALLPIIVGLVELAKRYGNLSSEHAPLLNGALTTAGYALMFFVMKNPTYEEIVVGVLGGVMTFLAGAGFYEMLVKPHFAKKSQVTLGYMYSTTRDGERVFQEVRGMRHDGDLDE